MSKFIIFLRRKNYQLLEFFRRRLDAPLDAEWTWVVDRLFSKIAWLKQSDEGKTEISKAVVEGVNIGKIYWLEVGLSSIIATFGLIQNSVAVIIGAMLIAPLLRPIQSMAFAIANGRHGLFWKSFKILFFSVALGVVIAFLVSRYLPFVEENNEILSRTAPNLIDFFIAVASAMIALLAFAYKRLYESVAGVAMATALMPPIAVIGIEFFLGNFGAAWGAFILFFTNLSSILVVGALMFIFYGFNPHQEDTKKTVRSLFVLTTIVVLLWFPLGASLQQIRHNIDMERDLKSFFEAELAERIEAADLSDFRVLGSTKSEKINIQGAIKLPEDVPLYRGVVDQLADQISEEFGKPVVLDLNIDRMASIQSNTMQIQLDEKLIEKTKFHFKQKFPEGLIITQEALELVANKWSVKTVYTLGKGVFMDDETQAIIETQVQLAFPNKEINFIWGDLPTRELPKIPAEPTADEIWFSGVAQRWGQFFEDYQNEDFSIENLDIRWKAEDEMKKVFIYFDLMVPDNFSESDVIDFRLKIDAFQETFSAEEIKVYPRIFPYFSLDFKATDLLMSVEEESLDAPEVLDEITDIEKE